MHYESKRRKLRIGPTEFITLLMVILAALMVILTVIGFMYGYGPIEMAEILAYMPVLEEITSVDLAPPEETIEEAPVRATGNKNSTSLDCHQDSCKQASKACERPVIGRMKKST